MSPDLIAAVKERIERGYTKEAISAELHSAGHSDEVIEQVLNQHGSYSAMDNVDEINVQPLKITKVFVDGCKLIIKRFDLMLSLALPLILMSILDTSLVAEENAILLAVVGLVSFVWYVLVSVSLIYIITSEQQQPISIMEGAAWAYKNIWSLSWIYVLTALIVYGGIFLLIVPGIIVTVLTFFAPYVYLKEGKRGLSALMRSRELVRGRWWTVFQMLFKVLMCMTALILLVGIATGFAMAAIGSNLYESLLESVVFNLIGAGFSVAGLYTGYQIYLWLAGTTKTAGVDDSSKWKYVSLACIGILLPIFIVVVVALTYDKLEIKGEEALPDNYYKEMLQDKNL